jgi:hypothetical protein
MEQNAFEKWYKKFDALDVSVENTHFKKNIAREAWDAAILHTVNSFPYISVSMKLADAFIERAATSKSNS